jgi:hypothetical protein
MGQCPLLLTPRSLFSLSGGEEGLHSQASQPEWTKSHSGSGKHRTAGTCTMHRVLPAVSSTLRGPEVTGVRSVDGRSVKERTESDAKRDGNTMVKGPTDSSTQR